MSEYRNTSAPAVLDAGSTGLVLLLAVVGLIGCADKVSTCSDESTVSIVKTLYQEAMGTILVAAPDATTARAQIAAGTSVEVRSIRTVGKDDKVGLMTCEGSISVKVPAELATAIATPGHLLNVATQSLELKVNGDRLERAVQYTSQMTDDGKEVRVQARGTQEMGQLIAMLGAKGFFEPKVPVAPMVATVAAATAPTVPETKSVSESTPTSENSRATEEKHTAAIASGGAAEVAGVGAAGAEVVPSFPCAGNLSITEKMICDTPSLARADAQLAKQYRLAQTKVSDVAALKQEQRGWMQVRNACADVACMENAYAKRLADLPR